MTNRPLMALSLPLLLLATQALAERTIGWETFSAEPAETTHLTTGFSLYEGRTIQGLVLSEDNPEFDGRKLNAPQVQLNVSLGDRGEAVIGHTVWRTLRSEDINEADGADPWFYTKLKLFSERDWTPTTSFIWGVLEPAANPPIGADNLAFYAFLAFSKHFPVADQGRIRLDLNLGTGIYESDLRDRQDDVFKTNLALWYLPAGQPWRAGVEFNRDQEVTGRWYDFTQGTDSRYRRERLAATVHRDRLWGDDRWGAFGTLSTGFVEQSEDWGLAGGVTYRFTPSR